MSKIIGFFFSKGSLRNKRGFTILELVVAFALLIIIAFSVVNMTLTNQTKFDYVKSYEADMFYSAKSIAKGIAKAYDGENFTLNLYNFVPVKDIENQDSIMLVNNFRDLNGRYDLKDYGKSLELILKYKFNPINITVTKDQMVGNSEVYVSMVNSEDESFSVADVNNMLLSIRGKSIGIGTHFTMIEKYYREDEKGFYYIIRDKDNSGTEVLEYEDYFR